MYACVIEAPSGDRYAISILALIILSAEPTVTVNRGKKVELSCVSTFIIKLFEIVEQKWLFNDKVWAKENVTVKTMVSFL